MYVKVKICKTDSLNERQYSEIYYFHHKDPNLQYQIPSLQFYFGKDAVHIEPLQNTEKIESSRIVNRIVSLPYGCIPRELFRFEVIWACIKIVESDKFKLYYLPAHPNRKNLQNFQETVPCAKIYFDLKLTISELATDAEGDPWKLMHRKLVDPPYSVCGPPSAWFAYYDRYQDVISSLSCSYSFYCCH